MLLVAALWAVSGCGEEDASVRGPQQPAPQTSEQAPPPEPEPESELVQVPDVVGEEGQGAVDSIEAEGLTATHDQLDPSDCTVEDQDETGEVGPETEVVLTLDCRERDWQAREGDDWPAFQAAFADSARDGCEALFALSPDGALYNDDEAYTVTDLSSCDRGRA